MVGMIVPTWGAAALRMWTFYQISMIVLATNIPVTVEIRAVYLKNAWRHKLYEMCLVLLS